MGIYEIKTPVATIQFTLDITPRIYNLTVCAYGDMWEEKSRDWETLKNYVKKEWNFSDGQTKELYAEAYVQGCKRISKLEADYIIENRKPLGTFYCESDNGVYVGIDNRTGDAWTEDFKSPTACKNWVKK